MDGVIEQDIRRDIGGDHQRITSKHPIVTDVTFKHVLLPVWMAAYKYGGRTFRFVVNGQTGKVQGERPWSKVKIALAVIAGADPRRRRPPAPTSGPWRTATSRRELRGTP